MCHGLYRYHAPGNNNKNMFVLSATNPGPIQVDVCGNFPWLASCCGWQATIQVMWCDDPVLPFYIYQLEPLPGCDMGYCAGDDVPCPLGQVYVADTDSCEGMYRAISMAVRQEWRLPDNIIIFIQSVSFNIKFLSIYLPNSIIHLTNSNGGHIDKL